MKTVTNYFTMTFPSRSANEGFARAAAAAFIAQLDPTLDELGDIKTAVSEAVTNCTVHGYRDSVGLITLTVRLYNPNGVEIIVRDKGCGIRNVEEARQPMFTTGDSQRSGMGFTIMESFMDKLSVKSTQGHGTTVKMRKELALRVSAL